MNNIHRLTLIAVFLLIGGSAFANPPPVNNLNDSGPGSLRAAIASANAGDTITFNLPVINNSITTITLTIGELDIAQNLTITGPGANLLAVSGNNSSRVFNITSSSATVTIFGLTITGGLSQGADSNGGNGSPGQGGGILNSGTLTLMNCTLSANNATGGAAGGNSGNGGDGDGGGIYSSGTLTLTGCTLLANIASGGVADDNSGNGGDGNGGGIYSSGTLTLMNCTLSANWARGAAPGGSSGTGAGNNAGNGKGGGIYSGNAVALTSCTLSANDVFGAYILAPKLAMPTVEAFSFSRRARRCCRIPSLAAMSLSPAALSLPPPTPLQGPMCMAA